MVPILEVTGLKKIYQNFMLRDVNFTVPEDCITGFIGVNGAGKSTAIHSILNLVQKDAGTIQFRGKDISKNEKAFKDKIGVVFDSGCFYEELSLKEMTELISSSYSHWNESAYKQYMDMFSLHPEQIVGTLSKGMKLKYSLALALSHDTELLIMDEPTSGLDPLMREQFLNILKAYLEPGGRAVFYSTHITADLEKAADMLIMIHNGAIIFEEEKDALLERFRIVKGDTRELSPDMEPLMLHFDKSSYGFTGITDKPEKLKQSGKDLLFERATAEDIMLAYVKEREQ